MYKVVLPFLVLIHLHVTIHGQNTIEKNYIQKFQRLSTGMFENPEGSKNGLIQLYQANPNLSDSLKAYTFFSIATCFGIMNRFDSGIVWLAKGLPLAPNNQRKTLALKNLGNLFFLNNQIDSAEKVFQSALEVSRRTNDKSSESIILGSMSSFYTSQFMFEKALRYLIQAEKVLDQNAVPDVVGKINLRSKMATIYYWMKNYKETIKIQQELLPQMLQNNLFSNYASACAEIGDCFIHVHEYKKADEFLENALSTYKKLNNLEYQGYVEMLQAKNSLKKNELVKGLATAANSYQKLLSQSSQYIVDITTIYLDLLANQGNFQTGIVLLQNRFYIEQLRKVVPSKKLDAELASLPFLKISLNNKEFVKKLDEIQVLQDSIAILDRSRLILDIQEKYETRLRDQEIEHLKESKKGQLLLFSGVTLVCMFVLVLILIRYRFKNLLKDQQLIQEKQQYDHLLRKAKWEEEEKLLKEEIIQQQKQELLRTSDEIKQLEKKLVEIVEKNESVTNEHLLLEFKKIKDDRQLLDNFMGNFNLILPNFTKELKLQHAALTTADLQFCALIRMNLTYKEIASLLNIELTSVYRKKYRLEEKLGIKQEEIELYLQKF